MARKKHGYDNYHNLTKTTSSDHTQSINNLLSGSSWNSTAGVAVELTYSFSNLSSIYTYSDDATTSVKAFSANQTINALKAMSLWSSVANIKFTEVLDTTSSSGTIRWGATDSSSVDTAYAYLPSSSSSGGDIWIGSGYDNYSNTTAGTYEAFVYIHELGHALGLTHPHESSVSAVRGEDQLKYSVMSYRSYAGDDLSGYTNEFFPTTLMINDIAAIQYLYGADYSYNSTDTKYSWSDNQKIFETIWDGGGNDTIDASNQSQGVVVNLTSGEWSQIGSSFWNGKAYVRDCLTIAYNATIENAIGSSQSDILNGNSANNTLSGLAGNDILSGYDGDDLIIGDAGNDVINGGNGNDVLTGGTGNDIFILNSTISTATNIDSLSDFNIADDLIYLENYIFTKLATNGQLNSNYFIANTSGTAADSNDYIVYNTSSGALSYDADGSGSNISVQIALLGSSLAITNADFIVI